MIILPVDSILHRVHLEDYGATAFNPGVHGNARFSPICNAEGQPIPTLYAGASLACALMETVFHDVPHVPGFQSVNGFLGGKRPQDLLATDPDRVIAAARDEVLGVLHG